MHWLTNRFSFKPIINTTKINGKIPTDGEKIFQLIEKKKYIYIYIYI